MKPIEYLSIYLPYEVKLLSTTTSKIYKLCPNTYNHGSEEVSISSVLESGHFVLFLNPISLLKKDMIGDLLKYCSKEGEFEQLVLKSISSGIFMDLVPMRVLLRLAKYHFDLFGLIDQGKAIDKSKL